MNTKAVIMNARGRKEEALVLLEHALETALEHDKPSAALRAHYNLAELRSQADRYQDAAAACADGLTLARRVGNRYWEYSFLGQLYPLFATGRWNDAVAMAEQLSEAEFSDLRFPFVGILGVGTQIRAQRGQLDEAERILSVLSDFSSSADVQERLTFSWATAQIALGRGDAARALESAAYVRTHAEEFGFGAEFAKESLVLFLEAALALGDIAKVEEGLSWIASLPLGRRPQFLRAHASRFGGRLAALRDDADEVERGLKGAAGLFREIEFPFYVAVSELELGEWLAEQGRTTEASQHVGEARSVFAQLEATPWLERAARVTLAEIEV
jgi:tetratricopeptide (TPR) repeat protein